MSFDLTKPCRFFKCIKFTEMFDVKSLRVKMCLTFFVRLLYMHKENMLYIQAKNSKSVQERNFGT